MKLLEELFQDAASEERRISVFTLPDARTRWFADPTAAEAFASTVNGDCYFGVGLMRPVASGRGSSSDCVGIGGLWCDLDWKSTKGNKPLAGDKETLRRFIETIPVKPSCIVDSGGGFHLYWIFKEPWLFDTEVERQRGASLAHGWHSWIIRQAPKWRLENCGDLARVLRVPGTTNRKYGEPIPCEIVESNELRYLPDDFDDYAAEPPKPTNGKHTANGAHDESVKERFEKLLAKGGKFKASFDHERDDLADASASGYDLSLCTMAAADGWNDADLSWLIGYHRNFWGENPEKADRPDYVGRTIGKARAAASTMIPAEPAESNGVDLSGIFNQFEEKTTAASDPGPTPESLLEVPGFISELAEHTLRTAPYPNEVLAFTGALAMQSLLAARRVRDSMDNRTNLYLLALAQSGSGKDWPRKVNIRLAHESGLIDQIGDRFASGEGLEDALARQPAMLFQTDEIDGMLQSINQARDGRSDSIMTAMLNFYGQSNAIYKTRKRAGKEGGGQTIHNPSLTVYGTAIPKHYYDAVSDKMLTNGFFARVISFDAGSRGNGQEAKSAPLPSRIVERAKAWKAIGTAGNLADQYPDPPTVEATTKAQQALHECRETADAEYARCSDAGDEGSMSIWARTWERARKLALIYACSSCPLDALEITEEAAKWGAAVSIHQTRRAIYLISIYRADGEFAGKVSQLLNMLRRWHAENGADAWLHFRIIGRKLRWPPNDHDAVMKSLIETDQLDVRKVQTGKRARREYRLTSYGLKNIHAMRQLAAQQAISDEE